MHLKTVQLGIQDQDNAEIKSGLTEGEEVVIDGTDRLDEGTLVRVRKPGELDAIARESGRGRGGRGRGGRGGGTGAAASGATGTSAPNGVQPSSAQPNGFQPGVGNNPGGFRDFKGREGGEGREGEFKGKKGGGAPQ